MSTSSLLTLNAATSPNAPGTVAVAGVNGFSTARSLAIIATVRGATGGVLDIYIQDSPDNVTWFDYWHLTQLSAGAAAKTFCYCPSASNAIVEIGSGLSPILAAGAVRGGPWCDWLRVLYVAGASTSAGGAQTARVLAAR